MNVDTVRDAIRWHEYRRSDWEYADPPEGDSSRCGGCGRTEQEHPIPNVRNVPDFAATFVALLDEVERLRGAIEQHRETELARLESSGLDDDGKPLFTPMEHDERLWDAL